MGRGSTAIVGIGEIPTGRHPDRGAISYALRVKGAGAEGLRTAMTTVAMVNFLTIFAFWALQRRIKSLAARESH